MKFFKSRFALLAIMSVLMASLAMPAVTASHAVNGTHDSTAENTTKLKDGIVETIATWVPFVVLFTLLGVALAAIGLKLFKGN